jgi:hypothetical protein
MDDGTILLDDTIYGVMAIVQVHWPIPVKGSKTNANILIQRSMNFMGIFNKTEGAERARRLH